MSETQGQKPSISNRQYDTPEEQMGDYVLDYINYGYLEMYRGIYRTIVRVYASMVTIFLRKKFGIRGLNDSTVGWGLVMLSLTAALETAYRVDFNLVSGGASASGNIGSFWFSIHIIAFVLVGVYRKKEAWWNLIRSREVRHGDGTGYSILYPPFRKLMKRWNLPILHTGLDYPKWYQIDARKFQKWV